VNQGSPRDLLAPLLDDAVESIRVEAGDSIGRIGNECGDDFFQQVIAERLHVRQRGLVEQRAIE